MEVIHNLDGAPWAHRPARVRYSSQGMKTKAPLIRRSRASKGSTSHERNQQGIGNLARFPTPVSRTPSDHASQETEQDADEGDYEEESPSSTLTTSQEKSSTRKGYPTPPILETETASTARSSSPLSILWKGNSDPFGALSIPVDARVNSLITFYRDFEIPSLYFLKDKSCFTSMAATKDWTDCVDGLRDKCFAYAFLARNATVVGMISHKHNRNSNLDQQALVYRSRSTTLLRSRLGDKRQLGSPSTLRAIHGLFGAEVLGRNHAEASVHGKMLRFLFEKQSETAKVDLRFMNQVLYNDTQLAAMFLSRPSFDLEKWVPSIFQPSWNAAASDLPSLEDVNTGFLDPSIASETLRSLFLMRREGMIIWQQSSSAKPEGSPLTMNWLMSRNLIAQGRLINHYLDLVERYDDSNAALSDYIYAQAYLSLAALYFTRAVSTSPIVCGVPLFDAQPKILAHLRDALGRSEKSVAQSRFANARLWALYVGASAEHARAKSDFDPSKGWFNSRLAQQAKTMGLLSWQKVREVLEGFLYTDNLHPHGSQWFWKTMGANLEG